jgi:hypothetical protein
MGVGAPQRAEEFHGGEIFSNGRPHMTKFLTKFLIAVALMPVGYVLAAMVVFGIEEYIFSVEQVPTPIAAKP